VAVSGGADSLLALALLAERGSAAFAVHAHFLPPDPGSGERAARLADACAELGVDFHELDLSRRFSREIILPFAEEYRDGRTPNPCALCNPRMKFGALMDAALELGADGLATGHYVRMRQHSGYGAVPARGADPSRDQSYFLCMTPAERLAGAVFPLGETFRREVPDLLAERGLVPPLPAESREICFVPEDDYQAFLPSLGLDMPGEGPILLNGREIGRHKGLWRYTPGQRRGMGVAWDEPLYVLGKDTVRNALIVGPAESNAARGLRAGGVNYFADFEAWPDKVLVQTRYRQKAAPARIERREDGLAAIFDEPRGIPAPGQAAAFYDQEDTLLAGSIIEAPL
jgi:tRNA-specific 2-thiouridylase